MIHASQLLRRALLADAVPSGKRGPKPAAPEDR
jgi:hypothetical protein